MPTARPLPTGAFLDGVFVDMYTALEAVSSGDPVYWSATQNRIGRGRSGVDAKSRIIGVALDDIAEETSGRVALLGRADDVLSGATPGSPVYLATNGGFRLTMPGSGNRIVQCGFAISATDLYVKIADFGKKT